MIGGVALCLLCAAVPSVRAQDSIVAVVNNEIITQKDLDDFMNFMRIQLSSQYQGESLERKIKSMKSDLLQRLIEDRLLLQEAHKSGITVEDARIKAKIQELKKNYSSDREFEEGLLSQGMTQQSLEKKMRDQMLIYTVIEQKVKGKIVSRPSEITEYYNQHPGGFIVPERREFISAMVTDKGMVEDIDELLAEGKTLDAICQEYSLKLNSFIASKGGELRKEIEDVVFTLNVGQTSGAILIGSTYYYFRVNQIFPARQQELKEVQSEIATMLYEKRLQEGVISLLEELKKHAYIRII